MYEAELHRLRGRALLAAFDTSPADAVAAGVAPSPDWYAAEKAITVDGWATVDSAGKPAHTVQITGATHLSLMDVPFLPLAPESLVRTMLGGTTIDPSRMLTLTTTILVAFLTGRTWPPC